MMISWLFALSLAQDADRSPKSRPAELLQAQSCEAGAAAPAKPPTELPSDRLVSVDDLPPCLSAVMKRLQASTSQLVGNSDARAVLQIGVGRAWSEAGLMFSTPDDLKIHYVEDVGPLTDILTSEWADYVSPDGELGWSGLVLIVDKDSTKVRLLNSPEPPLGAYESFLQLEAEFFPDKQRDVPAANSGASR